jgi:hypothetical protein
MNSRLRESRTLWKGEKSEIGLGANGNGGTVICLETTSVDHSSFGKVVRPSGRGEMKSSCEVSKLQL